MRVDASHIMSMIEDNDSDLMPCMFANDCLDHQCDAALRRWQIKLKSKEQADKSAIFRIFSKERMSVLLNWDVSSV